MITLIPLEDSFTIYQVADYKDIPSIIYESGFFSITKTDEEISILTNCTTHFGDIKSEGDWRGFRVEGILDFSLVGIINEITGPLKNNKISVFVLSTYNTDYIFVKDDAFRKAIDVLNSVSSVSVKE